MITILLSFHDLAFKGINVIDRWQDILQRAKIISGGITSVA